MDDVFIDEENNKTNSETDKSHQHHANIHPDNRANETPGTAGQDQV